MNAPEQSNESFQQRLIADLKRDKKKTGILAVLFIVGIVVGLRFLLKSKPSSASGGTGPVVTAEDVDNTQYGGSSTGRKKRGSAPKTPRRTMPDVKITRDLFKLHAETYHLIRAAKAGPHGPTTAETPGSGTPKEFTPKELAAAAVRDQAKILCLEMTIVSDTPSAFINGTVLRKGQTFVVLMPGGTIVSIDGKKPVGVILPASAKDAKKLAFTVEDVTSDACVVVKDDVRVTLKMPTDGLK